MVRDQKRSRAGRPHMKMTSGECVVRNVANASPSFCMRLSKELAFQQQRRRGEGKSTGEVAAAAASRGRLPKNEAIDISAFRRDDRVLHPHPGRVVAASDF